MAYSTVEKLWRRALPPASLFEDDTFQPGSISDISHTGTGGGLLDLGPRSNPRGSFALQVKCTRGGECNSLGVVNTGPLPQFRISLDGGLTWSRPLTPDPNGRIPYLDGGFDLVLTNAESGAPVTIGTGNAALVFTPLYAGCAVQIALGTKLGHTFYGGAAPPVAQGRRLLLTVTGTTTAAEAAAYLQGQAQVADYLAVAAGGTGAGAVLGAALTPIPLASFVVNDVYAAAVQPSPDLQLALEDAFAFVNGYLRDTYDLPISGWGGDLELAECRIARWNLIQKKGQQDKYPNFDPQKLGTMDWLTDVAGGTINLGVQETPPTRSFPLLVPPVDPLSAEAGAFPI